MNDEVAGSGTQLVEEAQKAMHNRPSFVRRYAAFAAQLVVVPVLVMFGLWWFIQRPVYDLGIAISRAQVVSKERPEASELRLSWKGQTVTSADVVTISVRNTGNQPLYAQDFDAPLTIQFPETSTVAKPSAKGSRDQLAPQAIQTDNTIVLTPLSLDVGDALHITALVLNLGGTATSDAVWRVSGHVLRVGDLNKTAQFVTVPTVAREGDRRRSTYYVIAASAVVFGWLFLTLVPFMVRNALRRAVRGPDSQEDSAATDRTYPRPTPDEMRIILEAAVGGLSDPHIENVAPEAIFAYAADKGMNRERAMFTMGYLEAFGFLAPPRLDPGLGPVCISGAGAVALANLVKKANQEGVPPD